MNFNLRVVSAWVVFYIGSLAPSNIYASSMWNHFVSAETIKDSMNLQMQKNDLEEVIEIIKNKNPLLSSTQLEMIKRITLHHDATIRGDSGQGLIFVPTKAATWVEISDHTPIRQSVSEIAKRGIRVLDIGCGSGVDVRTIVEQGGSAFAVDAEPEPLSILVKSLNPSDLPRVQISLGKFPGAMELEPNFFDTIILSHVVHYLSPIQLQNTYEQSYAALKQGGHLLLSTNSFEYYSNTFPWNLESYASWKKKLLEEAAGFVFPTYKEEYVSDPHKFASAHLQDFDFTAHNLKHAGFEILENYFFNISYSETEGKYVSVPNIPSASTAFSLVAKKP